MLAVGVDTGIEGALGRAHVAQHPRHDPSRRVREYDLAGRAPGIRIKREKRRVVVEHLFEVRDRPFGIDAVAAETAAELVVDAPGGHALERRRDNLERFLVPSHRVPAQAQLQIDRVRKLRCGAESAMG